MPGLPTISRGTLAVVLTSCLLAAVWYTTRDEGQQVEAATDPGSLTVSDDVLDGDGPDGDTVDDGTADDADGDGEGFTRSTLPPTERAPVFDLAAGSGCTPGTSRLPDGIWYGTIESVEDDRTMQFDLGCLFRAEDLPDDFAQVFADRFPDEPVPTAVEELVDPSAINRTIRSVWNTDWRYLDGSTASGDQGLVVFDEPLVVEIEISGGGTVRVTEIDPG